MSILKIENDEDICVRALREYAAFHESLTEISIVLMPKFFDAKARYQAPLADCQGKEQITRLWASRLARFHDYKLKPRHTLWDENGSTAFVHWEFIGKTGHKRVSFGGFSEITFNLKGKILSHIDYYDPFVFAYDWPVIGGWLKEKRSKIR